MIYENTFPAKKGIERGSWLNTSKTKKVKRYRCHTTITAYNAEEDLYLLVLKIWTV